MTAQLTPAPVDLPARKPGFPRFIQQLVEAGSQRQCLPAATEIAGGFANVIPVLEQGGKGVPILVRQYLKAGGRVLCFNVDSSFSNALDALILVDLRRASPQVLDRYLGKEGVWIFRARHDHSA